MWLDSRHEDMYLPGCQCPSNTKQHHLHNGKNRRYENAPLKPGTHSSSAKKQASRGNMTQAYGFKMSSWGTAFSSFQRGGRFVMLTPYTALNL